MNSEHRQAAWFRAPIALLALILLALGLLAGAPAALADPPVSNIDVACQAQQGELDSVRAAISAHNAQPHLFKIPQEQAAYDAYNAEADALDARKARAVSSLKSCVEAFQQVSEGGPLPKPSQDRINDLNDAKSKLPPNYVPPTNPPTRGGSNGKPAMTTVDPPMKPLFVSLRDPRAGNQTLKPAQPIGKVGDPDPSQPGKTIPPMGNDPTKPAIVPDHIVPLAQIVYMPGFIKLPVEQMYMVANSPMNLQWMTKSANAIKNSGSAARVAGADPKWLDEQLALEGSTKAKLQKIIDKLLAALPPG
jgi:hypothetical protein